MEYAEVKNQWFVGESNIRWSHRRSFGEHSSRKITQVSRAVVKVESYMYCASVLMLVLFADIIRYSRRV